MRDIIGKLQHVCHCFLGHSCAVLNMDQEEIELHANDLYYSTTIIFAINEGHDI